MQACAQARVWCAEVSANVRAQMHVCVVCFVCVCTNERMQMRVYVHVQIRVRVCMIAITDTQCIVYLVKTFSNKNKEIKKKIAGEEEIDRQK